MSCHSCLNCSNGICFGCFWPDLPFPDSFASGYIITVPAFDFSNIRYVPINNFSIIPPTPRPPAGCGIYSTFTNFNGGAYIVPIIGLGGVTGGQQIVGYNYRESGITTNSGSSICEHCSDCSPSGNLRTIPGVSIDINIFKCKGTVSASVTLSVPAINPGYCYFSNISFDPTFQVIFDIPNQLAIDPKTELTLQCNFQSLPYQQQIKITPI